MGWGYVRKKVQGGYTKKKYGPKNGVHGQAWPIWAMAHMGQAPYRPRPIWARAHVGQGPYGPGPGVGPHFGVTTKP